MKPQTQIDTPAHERWLIAEQHDLFDFYDAAADHDSGGFWWLDALGEPLRSEGKQLWLNARMTYAAALGHLAGRPRSSEQLEHGLKFLEKGPMRDVEHGGWFATLDEHNNVVDDTKQAYGHAFVLLAAAAALTAGLERARPLLVDALAILNEKFWQEDFGMFVDSWNRDFTVLSDYRGQNANMHLVESLLLAAEVTEDRVHLDRALRISERLIRDGAVLHEWRLPEHFTTEWSADLDFNKDDPVNRFTPYGSTNGHLLEWSRLLLQLNAALPTPARWIPEAAMAMFDRALLDGWDEERTGFAYTNDWNGEVVNGDRFHWVVAEAIGAAVALYRTTENQLYADWYAQFWEFAQTYHVQADGSWWHELNTSNEPIAEVWVGKPDLYHALQATFFSRLPVSQSIVRSLSETAG